jgi:pimeloyl-ACP methyl ester carboxylesterase
MTVSSNTYWMPAAAAGLLNQRLDRYVGIEDTFVQWPRRHASDVMRPGSELGKGDAMSLQTIDMPQTSAAGTGSATALRPFRVEIPEADLIDLRRRLDASRLPERETVADFSQGVPLATVEKLAKYWATEYDWRRVEAQLNALPNFITEIDGLDIHFIHVRSTHENALPLIITHGWPGSVVEQLKLVEPLTNPTAHGGTEADAFHLVIPSMPGYGFSGKPTAPGWGPERIARAWDVLMKRLGYTRYVAQGGDWGAVIVEIMGAQAPEGLLGIHSNMPNVVPEAIDVAAFAGATTPAGLSADEQHAYEMLVAFYKNVYYAFFMGTRPQTLTALSDSPIGLATFMLDHDARSLEMIARSFDGVAEGLTPDDVLDNITLFWLTNTGVSSARLYWENKLRFFTPKGVKVPAAASTFPTDLYYAPRSWAEQAYPTLLHFNRLPKGGHFAAWEQPKFLTQEVRASFKTLRT